MSKFFNVISFAAAFGLSTAAFAQETPTTEDTAAPASETGTELSTGEVVPPAEPKAYIREKTGDWSLECYDIGTEVEPCQMFQRLFGSAGNEVANVRIFHLPEGGQALAGALIAVPLETLLTAQLTIQVDDLPAKRYPFSLCDQQGCYARIGFNQLDVDAFQRGNKATVSLVPFVAPNQRIDLTLSLKGFTAGYGKITAVAQP